MAKRIGERGVDVFFYGLFADADVQREYGASPAQPRQARVDDFELRIGERATLVPAAGRRAYGMLYSLTHADLERLYSAPGLDRYLPEAVIAIPLDGTPVPALCYRLPETPSPGERNHDYAERLRRILEKLGFPEEYTSSV